MARARAALVFCGLGACLGAWLTLAAPAAGQQSGVFGDIRVRGPGVISIASFWVHMLGAQSPEVTAATQYRGEGNTDHPCTLDDIAYQCGLIAMSKLIELSAGKYFYCEFHDFDGDPRRWARCFEGDFRTLRPLEGVDSLNSQWVRSGWAFAHSLHTNELMADEAAARAEGAGMWAGPPDPVGEMPAQVTGAAVVVDGATLKIGSALVRLLNIDTPEIRQNCPVSFGTYPCGVMARAHLIRLTMGKIVHCTLSRRPGDDRIWGVCGQAAGAEGGLAEGSVTLNEQMVRDGWAVADRGVSREYLTIELEANAANVGLWSNSEFARPSLWRRGGR